MHRFRPLSRFAIVPSQVVIVPARAIVANLFKDVVIVLAVFKVGISWPHLNITLGSTSAPSGQKNRPLQRPLTLTFPRGLDHVVSLFWFPESKTVAHGKMGEVRAFLEDHVDIDKDADLDASDAQRWPLQATSRDRSKARHIGLVRVSTEILSSTRQ